MSLTEAIFARPSYSQMERLIAAEEVKNRIMSTYVGTPLVASTAAGMTDTDRIYVYVGSETGYTSGNWYYYDGSAWTSGGVYNSTAFETDDTLTIPDAAADSKVVGDELSDLKNALTAVEIVDTASGTIASFADGSDSLLVKGLMVQMEPIQAGSGDPSPTNIRPISGRDSVTVTRSDFQGEHAQSIEIQLGQTVYGGTLDVTQGVLTVDRAIVDLGDMEWKPNASSHRAYFDNFPTYGCKLPQSGAVVGGLIAEEYLEISANSNLYLGTFALSQNNTLIFYYDGTNLPTGKMVYPLAQPVEVQLTAQQITTLLGQNNVWSDADSVSVDYVADTKLYIEQLTEPDSDMVADMNITSGRYFMVGNSLYLATANIANGAAITVGVNCTRTSLAEALNAINS